MEGVIQSKLVYVTNIDFSNANGYPEKIFGQIGAFSKNFYEITLICRKKRRYFACNPMKSETEFRRVSIFEVLKIIMDHRFVYIRWPLLTPSILLFYLLIMMGQKRAVSEIPTFPMRKELANYSGYEFWYLYFSELLFRPIVDLSVFKYACVGNERHFASEKCVFFKNGVRKFHKPYQGYTGKDVLQLVFVGNFGRHLGRFGLDRVFEGLNQYQERKGDGIFVDCRLNIVGCEKDELIRCYGEDLPRNIICHGFLSTSSLNKLMHDMDFGIGVLGFHRVGIFEASPLKERLYLSFGLPYLSSVSDEDLDFFPNAKIKIPSDDSGVDFSEIMLEIKRRELSSLSNKTKIYEFAKKNINWDQAMSEVLKEFKNNA